MDLRAPLTFRPVYQELVWGGRRMARWRGDLPPGPIGESWDLADHERGMSVVADGPLVGVTLRELVAHDVSSLVGSGYTEPIFPLMIKLIDAKDRLSVQVHPDDRLARALGVGPNGKTECWVILEDGGELFVGTRPGVDRVAFEQALAQGTLADTLNRFDCKAGDFFFLEARTVHALGAGCLLYEIQQTSDITFRVYDWGRAGLDGKPRPLHVPESLTTIDFASGFPDGRAGPRRPPWQLGAEGGGDLRLLADGRTFQVEERRLPGAGGRITRRLEGTCAVVTCTAGEGILSTDGGRVPLAPMRTALVPAAAGGWEITSTDSAVHVLVASPRWHPSP